MTILFNHFDNITVAMVKARTQLVQEAAQAIKDIAQGQCPVDTGHLRDSHYIRTPTVNGYPGGGNGNLAVICDAPNEGEAYVSCGANHAVFVHQGTKRMGARPWLANAALSYESAYQSKWQSLESFLG